MYAYKIITNINGIRYSWFNNDQPPFSLKYEANIPTFPIIPNSKLFVYKKTQDAEDFLDNRNWPDSELWLCETTGLCKAPNINYASIPNCKMEDYWAGKFKISGKCSNNFWLADSVTLLEQIK